MDDYIIKSDISVEKLNYTSLSELIFDKLSQNCDKNFIIDCSSGRKWSRKQVLDMSLNFAYYLINDCKLSKGDIIVFAMDNTVIHAIGLLGVLLAGGVYLSFAGHMKEYEMRINLEKTKPIVVICFDNNYQMISKCCKDLPFIQKVLLIDNKYGNDLQLSQPTVEDICKTQRKPEIVLPVPMGPNDHATLGMSSGSTGATKAVINLHRNWLSSIEAKAHREMHSITCEDILLSQYLAFADGLYFLFAAINGGAQVAIVESTRDVNYIYDCIHKYDISHAFLEPKKLNHLTKNYKRFDKNYLKSLKNVLSGTAPLAESTYRFIVDNYKWEAFRKNYGSTEAILITQIYISDAKQLRNDGTVGKVSPNTEIKVIDEMGNSLPANTKGEICVRGGQVTPGYYNNTTETANAFTFDGFFKTGDFGYYDENYFFFIVGRIKEVINVEGVKLFPPELENILMLNLNVINAAVIGIKDEKRGEVPMAFVTVVEGSTVTVNELLDFFNSRVNYFKQLRGGLKIIDKMPVNSNNKIMKLKLKEMI